MEETNTKILIGSISQYIDRTVILGDMVDKEPILLLNVVLNNYYYALSQLEAGNTRYNSIVQDLVKKINVLRHNCKDICLYKNKLVYKGNTPPTVDDYNLIISKLNTSLTTDVFTENFEDAEDDNPNNIRITSLPTDGVLFYQGVKVIVGDIISINNISNLTYEVEEFNCLPIGEVDPLLDDFFNFQISDDNSNELYSLTTTIKLTSLVSLCTPTIPPIIELNDNIVNLTLIRINEVETISYNAGLNITDEDSSLNDITSNWNLVSGVAENTSRIDDDFNFTVEGVYVYEVVATDEYNNVVTDTITFNIFPYISQSPVISPIQNINLVLNQNSTVSYEVTPTITDTDSTQQQLITNWNLISGAENSTSNNDSIFIFTGEGSYTYELTVVDQDGNSDTEQIVFNIEKANTAPIAVTDNINTLQDNSINFNVFNNDIDEEGEGITIIGNTLPTNGVLTILNSTTGELSYTPNTDYYGPDSFTYTISDGELTSTASVNITVNICVDKPVANAGGDVTYDIDNSSVTTKTLDGSSSSANSSSYSSILWEVVDGPTGVTFSSAIAILTPNSLTPTIAITNNTALEGDYTIRLSITNSCLEVSTDEINVVLAAIVNPNVAPTTSQNNLDFIIQENILIETFSDNADLNLFTETFSDVDNDSPNNVRITSLPTQGVLLYNNSVVSIGFEFPSSDTSNLTYQLENVKQEIDGTFIYAENIDDEITTLESNGFVLDNYSNGVYTLSKTTTSSVIPITSDGTFDTVQGDINQSGNVTGAGWFNGSGSADIIIPHTVAEGGIARGCPASPQGGNFAGGVGGSSDEELLTTIDVIAGESYSVKFYQTHAGHTATVHSVLDTSVPHSGHWEVSLNNEILDSPSMVFEGFGNQTWQEETLIFTATQSGTFNLSFKALSDNDEWVFLGLDDVRVESNVTNTTEETEVLTGVVFNDSFEYQVSEDTTEELYSNISTISINFNN